MSEKLDEIKEQLDELLIKQLELIQDYINVTVECETHQKNGFINLAKARYIQGSHTVSRNCLFSEDSEEERPAILTVTREDCTVDLESEDSPVVAYQKPKLNVNADTSLESQLNKQFGILSSSTLKHAKTDFRRCVEKTIERAEIVQQSVAIREKYKLLMKQKFEIENSIPNSSSLAEP